LNRLIIKAYSASLNKALTINFGNIDVGGYSNVLDAAALLVATVVAVLADASMTSAHTTVTRTTTVVTPEIIGLHRVRTRIRNHAVAHRHPRIFDRRKLGMLCVLPPDIQVALDWPGPACAYSDNFIFLPGRHRHIK